MTPAIGVLAAILLHEAGHAAAALLCGLKIHSVGFKWPLGPCVRAERGTPKQTAVIAIAGPLANLLLAMIWPTFAAMNVLVAVACMLPIRGFDGKHFATAVAAAMRDT